MSDSIDGRFINLADLRYRILIVEDVGRWNWWSAYEIK